MKYNSPEFKIVIALLVLAWALNVYAAELLPENLLVLPWNQIAIATAIALWGGLTRTVDRLARTDDEHIGRGIISDLVTSAGCGFITYMIGAFQAWNIWILGAILWMGGYLGAKYLEAISEVIVSKISSSGTKKE